MQPSDADLERELDRQCVADGEALSDFLTMFATMVGVDLVEDPDPPDPPDEGAFGYIPGEDEPSPRNRERWAWARY